MRRPEVEVRQGTLQIAKLILVLISIGFVAVGCGSASGDSGANEDGGTSEDRGASDDSGTSEDSDDSGASEDRDDSSASEDTAVASEPTPTPTPQPEPTQAPIDETPDRSNVELVVDVVDAAPLYGFRQPTMGGGDVWFVGEEGVARIDGETLQEEARLDLRAESQVVFSAGSAWVAVSERGVGNRLVQLDLQTNEEIGRVPLCSSDIDDIVSYADHVWLTCGGTIYRFSADTGAAVSEIDVRRAEYFAVDDANDTIWVSTSKGILGLDGESAEVIADIEFDEAEQPWRPLVASGALWVPDAQLGTVTRVDLATTAVTATITVGQAPFQPVSNGTTVWVPNRNDDTVSRIDIASNEVTLLTASESHETVAITADGLWTTQFYDNTVTLVDPDTGLIRRAFAMGDEPLVVSFGASNDVWVLNQDDGTFARISAAN